MKLNFGAVLLMLSLIFSLTLTESTLDTTANPIVKGEKITFRQLPRGQAYKVETPPKTWILTSYEDIARKVILAMRDKPPYDLIKDGLKTKTLTDDVIEKSIVYELPFVIPGTISMICSVVIPLTGLIFCCCRCFGRCGGKLEEESMNFSPVKQRHRLSVAIALCSVFILIGSSCVFVSSDRLGTSLPLLNTVLEESIDDIITYKNNTIKELKYVTRAEMTFASTLVADDLNGISSHVAGPVMSEARPIVHPLLDVMIRTGHVMSKVKAILKNISVTVNELRNLGNELRHQLEETRKNLTQVRQDCDNDAQATFDGICEKIPSGDTLTAVADFYKVPNVTKELKDVEDALKTDIILEAKKGNSTFEEIPLKVARSTQPGRQDIMNFITELEDLASIKVNDLEDNADQFIQDKLEPFRQDMNYYIGPDGTLLRFDNFRFFSLLGIACTVLFAVLIMYCGLTGGVIGSRDYDTPSTRSRTADCGGRTLMAAVAFFFLCSLFVNFILGMLFIFGSNGTVLCKSAADLALVEQIVDDPTFLGYYPLSKTLLGDGTVEMKFSTVLRGCGRDETPWELLQLDRTFNLTNMTNYKHKIPPMDEIFKELNTTIADIRILTSDAESNLNESIEAGVHRILFNKFTEQIKKPLVNASLEQFSDNLQKLSVTAKDSSQTIADSLEFLANNILKIQNDIVDTASDLTLILKSKIEQLEEKGNTTVENVEDAFKRVKELDTFLQHRALQLANEVSRIYLDRVLGWIDQYVEEAIRKVRKDVGKCQPIRNIYDATVSAACDNLLSSLNALWLSLGTIAVFSVFTIILCVRLAKHYRRAERSSSNAKASTYGVPLTLFTSASRPNRKSVTPWKKVNKNSPVPSDLQALRWV